MILDLNLASDLFGFLDEFQNADLNDCVDFFCEKHDIDATDELIDEIADFFFANWQWASTKTSESKLQPTMVV